jgi:hypothetical protein
LLCSILNGCRHLENPGFEQNCDQAFRGGQAYGKLPLMSRRLAPLVVAAIILSATRLSADIAPTDFKGGDIAPVGTSDIRLLSATVDIDWGTPCALSATFVLENGSPHAVEIPLGFPMVVGFAPLPKRFEPNLLFVFDGAPVKRSAITKVGNPQSDEMVWYRCTHTFQPGKSTVTVRSRLPAGQVYDWPCRETLRYCIETGGSWKGTIGYEEVNIHFPRPISKEQITDATPDSYTVSGNVVRWQFNDFKPQGDDHDIRLEYFRPDVLAVLAKVRAAHQKKPDDSALALKLARHLFALGARKGYTHFPPGYLTRTEYAALLANVSSDEDRALVQSRYVLSDKDRYKEVGSAWTPERDSMVRLLNKIDYQPPAAKSPYVDEAKTLVEEILRKEPANAAAWNVYVANYYKFHFAAASPEYPADDYYPHQIDLIAKAHQVCPNDPGIRLWFECASGRHTPDMFGIWRQLAKYGVFDIDYLDPNYHYW